MAVEATPALRFTAVIDNATGNAHSAQTLTNIGTRMAAEMRSQIVAAGQNPDALTAAQRATWALAWIENAVREAFKAIVVNKERSVAEATTHATINSAIADL